MVFFRAFCANQSINVSGAVYKAFGNRSAAQEAFDQAKASGMVRAV